jgi:DNA-binding transcriptional LysR family regulator
MIRLRQLQALSYILSSRTMTAASELFGVTQPAMSRLISQPEAAAHRYAQQSAVGEVIHERQLHSAC